MAATYNELYLTARRKLREMGVEEDQLEARELVCAATGKSRAQFLRDRYLYTSHELEERAQALLERRLTGEPLAYIIGEWEFYGLPLTVTPEVLIPRPDTETVAERAIEKAKEVVSSGRVLDLCAGSGCIGLAVAQNVPGCRVVLAELDEGAIRVSRQNIRRNRLNSAVSVMKADALEKPNPHIGTFNVIVSNPPYIRSGDIPGLDASVRDYEPLTALDGGEDGLKFYRAIAGNWKSVLRPGGSLIFEVGYDQAADVERLLAQEGFSEIITTRDHNGVWRVVEGRYGAVPPV